MRAPNLMTSMLVSLTVRPGRPYHVLYPIAYMGMIYFLSSIPGAHVIPEDSTAVAFSWVPPGIQNALHVPLYAGLAFLWCWSLRILHIPLRALGALALLLTAGYGLFDEWHQSLVPGRYGSATDGTANAFGGIAGVCLFFWWFKAVARR